MIIKCADDNTAISSTTLNDLDSGSSALIWWLDIKTVDGDRTKYTFRSSSGMPDSFHPYLACTDGTANLIGDLYAAGAGTARLVSWPSYSWSAGRAGKANFSIAIPDGGDSDVTYLFDAGYDSANATFLGARFGFGFYSVAGSQKILLDSGRVYASELNDTTIQLECIGSGERLKGQIPGVEINTEQWVLIEDTEDNPDSTNPWEQLDAVAGTTQGRYRKGQKDGTSPLWPNLPGQRDMSHTRPDSHIGDWG